ncbi:MAG: translocation/assembly module TamB domain-containing protein [Candidatus Sericytochromatia bacterium]|nr:translocation/assembly module TamB domain-containing protein [Candidatus Sericytochromatia bacterium]
MARRWAIALGLLGGFAGAAALAVAIATTPAVSTRLAQEALRRLASDLPGVVRLKDLQVDPWRAQAVVTGLTLSTRQDPARPLLAVPRLELAWSGWALLWGRFELTHVQAEAPRLAVRHLGAGRTDWDAFLSPTEPAQGASPIDLRRVSWRDGVLDFEDLPQHLSLALAGVAGDVQLRLDESEADGGVRAHAGTLRLKGESWPLGPAEVQFRQADRHVTLPRVLLDAQGLRLRAQGELTGQGRDWQPRLAGILDAEPGSWPRWRQLRPLGLAGQWRCDWQTAGLLSRPELGFQLTGRALRLGGLAVPALSARLRLTPDQLLLSDARATLVRGRLRAQGELPLVAGASGRLELDGQTLPIVTLAKLAGVTLPLGLEGDMSGHLVARGRGLDLSDWQLDGPLGLSGRFAAVPAAGSYRLAAQAQLRRRRLDLLHLHAAFAGGSVNGRMRIADVMAPSPLVTLVGRHSQLDLAPLLALGETSAPLQGRVDGAFRLTLPGTDRRRWFGEGAVQLAGRVPAAEIDASADVPLSGGSPWRLRDDRLTLPGGYGRLLGGRLHFNGSVPLDAPSTQARLTVSLQDLSMVEIGRRYLASLPPPAGRLDGTLQVHGRRVELEPVRLHTLGGRVRLSGHCQVATPPRYALNAEVSELALDALQTWLNPGAMPLSGTAGASLTVMGAGSAYQVAGPWRLRGTAWMPEGQIPGARRMVPVTGNGRMRLTPGALALERAHVQLAELAVQGAGRYDPRGDTAIAFQAEASRLGPAARILGLAGLEGEGLRLQARAQGPARQIRLGGRLSADWLARGQARCERFLGQFSGELGERLRLRGQLAGQGSEAAGVSLSHWRLPFQYDAPGRSPTAGRLEAPDLRVQFERGQLLGRLSWDRPSGTAGLRLQSKALTLGDLLTAMPGQNAPRETPVRLAVDLRGQAKDLAGEARLEVAPFEHRKHRFGASQLRGEARSGILRLMGSLFGGQATLQGRVPLGGGDVSLRLASPGVRLAPLLAWFPEAWRGKVQWPTDGELQGTLQVSADPSRPRQAKASLDVSRFQLSYPDLEVRNDGPWVLRLADRALHVEAFRLVGGGTRLGAHGTVGLDRAADLALDGTLDMALLEKVAPGQFAGAIGQVRVEGALRGHPGRADVQGFLNLRDGQLETRSLPQPIHDMSASLRVTHNQVYLDELQAGFGQTGRLEAVGGAQLDGRGVPKRVSLQCSAREIGVRAPGLEALANADLTYVGAAGKGKLDGQIKILEGAYTRDVALTPSLGTLRAPRGSAAELLANPWIAQTALRLQLSIPDRFVVRNNIARGELRGDVLVLGTPGQPVAVGRVEARDAQFTFQERAYEVETATVDFIDPHQLVPYLNLAAKSTIQGVDVRLQATGTPQKLKLDLSSTPMMSQTDILTLIATGQTQGALNEGGGAGLTTASNFLLDQVAAGVARSITEQGVVDVLKVKPGSVDPAGPGGASFTVGKRINEKLTVTYTQDISAPAGKTPGRVMIFDYLLTDVIVLKLEQDLGGSFNASARYRLPIR